MNKLSNFNETKQEYARLPNGTDLTISGKGSLQLLTECNGKQIILILKDVRYIPNFKVKLISEIALAEDGHKLVREGNSVKIFKNNEIIGQGTQIGGLGSMYCLNKYKKPEISINALKLISLQSAHESLGHASPERLIDMSNSGKYGFKLSDKSFSTCDACSATKLTAPAQPTECTRIATKPGEIVNADVIGPINDVNPDVKFIPIIIDRATNYAAVECMKTKDVRQHGT